MNWPMDQTFSQMEPEELYSINRNNMEELEADEEMKLVKLIG